MSAVKVYPTGRVFTGYLSLRHLSSVRVYVHKTLQCVSIMIRYFLEEKNFKHAHSNSSQVFFFSSCTPNPVPDPRDGPWFQGINPSSPTHALRCGNAEYISTHAPRLHWCSAFFSLPTFPRFHRPKPDTSPKKTTSGMYRGKHLYYFDLMVSPSRFLFDEKNAIMTLLSVRQYYPSYNTSSKKT